MRLECEVVILKDSDYCLGVPARRSTKTSKAIVTLGKNHIKIAPGNVKNVHKERVSAGRMSLVFVDPPLTLIVMKSVPAHLQRFLEKLSAILKGDDISLKSLDKVKQSDFKAAVKSMKVTSDNLRGITYPPSLETLEPFFFDLLPSSLLALNLSRNLLVSLPDSIMRAKGLQNLNLSHNLLTSLPRDISDMPLRCLFLDHNRLPCLPYDLKTRRFEKLYFDYNPMIAALPESILPWDLKMIGNMISTKCSCCRKWSPSSLLSLSFVRVMATDFTVETDMMQSITMRALTCKKCVYLVNGRR
ncbi:leucine Rich repeat-containing domain protein [Ancylostoma duodenale]|uniref:Leucine Rich repeat-containing domain protein n=1 Tax=Ancylostoma duodenale TaxID=51022 RepID=A0A0C2HCU7_9BILA|nr:leucine Rich repeat-containing domain protein [Ancylostoma duodenale]